MIGIQLGVACEIWLTISLAFFAWAISPLPSDKRRQLRQSAEVSHET